MLRTPLGNFTPVFDDAGALVALEHVHAEFTAPKDTRITALQKWLDGFFKGVNAPCPIPLKPQGTAHQQRVWQAISAIPWGQTRSYGEIAAELGSGPRAVGTACGRNPIILLIPCHRVLGSGGALGGYSGFEGLKTKQWLLDHEQRYANPHKLAA